MNEIRKCVVCGNFYLARNCKQVCCSKECLKVRQNEISKQWQRHKAEEKRKRKMEITYVCAECGEEFFSPTSRKYCSDYCRNKANNRIYRERMRFESVKVSKAYEPEAERKKRRPKAKSLVEICKEAKAHGMDYGEYVVWLGEHGDGQ